MASIPRGPNSRRVVPRGLDSEQLARLRWLLEDPDTWVLRPGWNRFLLHGDRATLVDPASLSHSHRVAALAWLDQQRHALHAALEGGESAPPGWVESLPIHRRLRELLGR